MTQKSCDNHAEKCRRVPARGGALEYRGRAVHLCDDCQGRVAAGKRLWLDDRYDREDEAAELNVEAAGEFEQRRAHFEAWLRKNRQLQIEFDAMADRARQYRGKFSAWAICNVLRWNQFIETEGDTDYKISNTHVGMLARRYMELDPEDRGGFFDIRPMTGEDFEATKRKCGIK